MARAQISTPIGVLGLVATDAGLANVTFGPARRDASGGDGASAHLAVAIQQLEEYFAGARTVFSLTLDWSGVDGLRLTVLQLLEANVGFGQFTTYGDLAAQAHAPGAAQAIGGIMGSNPLPIVVPCHRVLAADGLGGFGGGLRTKEWLLAWEGVLPQALDVG